jgi:hypothetical protein
VASSSLLPLLVSGTTVPVSDVLQYFSPKKTATINNCGSAYKFQKDAINNDARNHDSRNHDDDHNRGDSDGDNRDAHNPFQHNTRLLPTPAELPGQQKINISFS